MKIRRNFVSLPLFICDRLKFTRSIVFVDLVRLILPRARTKSSRIDRKTTIHRDESQLTKYSTNDGLSLSV